MNIGRKNLIVTIYQVQNIPCCYITFPFEPEIYCTVLESYQKKINSREDFFLKRWKTNSFLLDIFVIFQILNSCSK